MARHMILFNITIFGQLYPQVHKDSVIVIKGENVLYVRRL